MIPFLAQASSDLSVQPHWYMALAAVLFVIGAAGLLLRRNALVMFMSIELMLNAVNLTFVAADSGLGSLEGQISVLFVTVESTPEVHEISFYTEHVGMLVMSMDGQMMVVVGSCENNVRILHCSSNDKKVLLKIQW